MLNERALTVWPYSWSRVHYASLHMVAFLLDSYNSALVVQSYYTHLYFPGRDAPSTPGSPYADLLQVNGSRLVDVDGVTNT